MIASMTGFARVAVPAGGVTFVWELKSVNGRGLDLRFRLPPRLDHLEGECRRRARDRLARGNCAFGLSEEARGPARMPGFNDEALALVVALAKRLAREEGIAPATADGLLALPGVLVEGEPALDEGAVEARDAALLAGFDAALDALLAVRREEGRELGARLSERLGAMAALVGEAEALARQAPEHFRARIAEQVARLAPDLALDPARLHQEIVLAATRADISEEIDRLKAHLAAAHGEIVKREPVGRRLEFLAQEFHREANTLLSKAHEGRLAAIGLDLKTIVDQFREQVQNIE